MIIKIKYLNKFNKLNGKCNGKLEIHELQPQGSWCLDGHLNVDLLFANATNIISEIRMHALQSVLNLSKFIISIIH